MKKKIMTPKRVFMYHVPSETGSGKAVLKTDVDIHREYWPYWRKKMRKKWGKKHKLITFNNCLQDWATFHWATELGVEDDKPEG